ncbi:MAG: putative Na(+)/H(+) antiporter [Bacteroidetes bacterium]|nr:MAG: putative Na(+)/H(+) antiporter [Bacteroidota bacterium]
MNIGVTLVAVGFMVFLAHVFAEIFSRKKIPDVLMLIIIGLIVGPILKIVTIEAFGMIGPVFTTITLVTILFEGGTELKLEELKKSMRGTSLLTNLNFFATMIVVGLIGWFVYELEPLVSFTLGAIVGGTSSAVVIPLVRQLTIGKKSGTILILESAFSDVLCIVFALALIETIEIGEINVGLVFGKVLASFVLATLIGLAGAIFWSLILHKIRTIKNSIFTTPAFVFIIFGISDLLGYSGAIAALSFGIGLANMEILASPRMRRYINRQADTFNETEKVLFSEIVFLLKTFFFVYIGISIQLRDLRPLLIGLGITTVLFFLRIPVVRFSMPKDQTDNRDLYYMSAIFPKGLAAAVLATIPLQRGIAGGEFIMNVTFSIVLFSITFTSFLIPMIDKVPAIRKFYDVSFTFYGWFNDLVRKTDPIDEVHLIGNNVDDEPEREVNSPSTPETEKTDLKKDK